MKKFILMLLVVIICLCSACGNTDSRTKKVAKQMISIVDEYLDFEKEAEEAEAEIDKLFVRVVAPEGDPLSSEKRLYLYMLSLSNQMRFTSYQIIKNDAEGTVEAEKDLLESRNRLAKEIGVKQK